MQLQQKKSDFVRMHHNENVSEEMIDIMITAAKVTAGKFGSGHDWYRNEKDDLIQELFIKIWESLHLFEPERNIMFKTFVYAVLENEAKDFIRKKKSKTEKMNLPIWPDLYDHDEPSFEYQMKYAADIYIKTPEQTILDREYRKEITDSVCSLSEKNREYLFYRFGFFENEAHDAEETRFHFYLPERYGKRLEKNALNQVRKKLTVKKKGGIIKNPKRRKQSKWYFMYPAA